MLPSTLLRETPLCVVDFETTGLSPKVGARVVEVSVARVIAGRAPEIVLDTLVDPEGPVLCTSIHGISDDDVVGAPRFSEVVGNLVRVLDGALVGAYNASFDMSFLAAEAQLARCTSQLRLPPHVCLMWMRPLLGLSERCSLDNACQQHGLSSGTHRAAEDALACAHMWDRYVAAAEARGIHTVADLACAGSHKYLRSLESRPYGGGDFSAVGGTISGTALKPRRTPIIPPTAAAQSKPAGESASVRCRRYWQALVDSLADGVISPQEFNAIDQLQRSLQLPRESIRAIHARLFADRLREFAEDLTISADEIDHLRDLRSILGQLGWAPGA